MSTGEPQGWWRYNATMPDNWNWWATRLPNYDTSTILGWTPPLVLNTAPTYEELASRVNALEQELQFLKQQLKGDEAS